MDTVSLTELQYQQLPPEIVVRHEAGHAVMAHRCGGFVKRIVFGRRASGENYGRAFWAVPDRDQHVLVLTGGVLVLFLHDCPTETAYRSFIDWVSTPRGYLMEEVWITEGAFRCARTHGRWYPECDSGIWRAWHSLELAQRRAAHRAGVRHG